MVNCLLEDKCDRKHGRGESMVRQSLEDNEEANARRMSDVGVSKTLCV